MVSYVEGCWRKCNNVLQKSGRLYTSAFLLVQDCSHEELRHVVRNCSWIYMTCFDRKSVIAMSRRDQAGTETRLLVPPWNRTAIFVYPYWVKTENAYWFSGLENYNGSTEVTQNKVRFPFTHVFSAICLKLCRQSGFILKYGPRLLI